MYYFIYFISFLEGYTTLAVEMLAIRNITPIVGSNVVITSIILGVILVALSYGYYVGGILGNNKSKQQIIFLLLINFLLSGLFYTFISFYFQKELLIFLAQYFESSTLGILISSIALFVIPVFLASQTIPLLSSLFKDDNRVEGFGKLLFFSTIGSFLGSTLTTLYFLPKIGLYDTILFNGVILLLLGLSILLLFFKEIRIFLKIIFFLFYTFFLSFFLVLIFFVDLSKILSVSSLIYGFPSDFIQKYSAQTPYYDVEIFEFNKRHLMTLNGSHSAIIFQENKESDFFNITEAEALIKLKKPKNVLLIGAGGFVFPNQMAKYDFIESITVNDVDDSLKEISEKYFLEKKLEDKISYEGGGARLFIHNAIESGKKYDFIFVNAYTDKRSIPDQLTTKEYFESLKEISNGPIFFYMVFDSEGQSKFYNNILTTLDSVYSSVYLKNLDTFYYGQKGGNFTLLSEEILGFSGYSIANYENGKIYTDNLNSAFLDNYKMVESLY